MVATEEGEKPTEATREASEERGTRPSRATPGAAEASEARLEATEDVGVVVAEDRMGVTEAVATTPVAVTSVGAAVASSQTTGVNRWPGSSIPNSGAAVPRYVRWTVYYAVGQIFRFLV